MPARTQPKGERVAVVTPGGREHGVLTRHGTKSITVKLDSGKTVTLKEWTGQHAGQGVYRHPDWPSHFTRVYEANPTPGQISRARSWDAANFHDAETARHLGDQRFRYVPFHSLTASDQRQAVAAYVHKRVGGKYDFRDEHYYYPVKQNGKLTGARAQRVLAIPRARLDDDAYMASLGYQINEGWQTNPPESIVESPVLEKLASSLIGDMKEPNMYFVGNGSLIVAVTTDKDFAIGIAEQMSNGMVEDRQHGVVWDHDGGGWLQMHESNPGPRIRAIADRLAHGQH